MGYPVSRNPKGRPKGVPNKMTTEIKAVILEALQELGGKDYLIQQALKENASPFMSLLGKAMPLQLVGDPNNPLETVTRLKEEDRVILDRYFETKGAK